MFHKSCYKIIKRNYLQVVCFLREKKKIRARLYLPDIYFVFDLLVIFVLFFHPFQPPTQPAKKKMSLIFHHNTNKIVYAVDLFFSFLSSFLMPDSRRLWNSLYIKYRKKIVPLFCIRQKLYENQFVDINSETFFYLSQ